MKNAIVAFLVLFTSNLLAQSPIRSAAQPIAPSTAAQSPTIIEQIKKSVILIETDCYVIGTDGKPEIARDGKPKFSGFAGTAFAMTLPDPRLPANSGFTYLVTNHHVADPGIEDGKPCQVAQYVLHVETKAPDANGSYVATVVLPAFALDWNYPTDPSVDLAITPLAADWQKIDLIAIPSTLLMSDADVASNRVEEGDSIMFTGVFVQMIGQTHSEPIVRQGKIAMMPEEPVPTTLRSLGSIYLVDCHVFGGNSGSPMFVDLAGQRYNGLTVGNNLRLLGVVSGYVIEGSKFELQTVASYAGTVAANSGIAIVVPAQKVLDLLNNNKLRGQREAEIASIKK